MKLAIRIARSLLQARWRQTLVATTGVTFSVGMFVALLGFMEGLNQMLDALFLNRTPHIRLYNELKPAAVQPVMMMPAYRAGHHFIHSVKTKDSRTEIRNSTAILEALRKDGRVAGIAPKVTMEVFFNEGPSDIAASVNGIDFLREDALFHFSDYVQSGDASSLDKVPNSIILGKALAERLLTNVGERVQLTTPQGAQFNLKVVALWQSGIQDFDRIQSFTSLATARKLSGKTGNYITDIQIRLKNIDDAPAFAKTYSHLFGTSAQDVQTLSAEFETGSFIRSLISYVVGITLLTVSGFGIYNILNMMIYEKMDTIAILKATGFSGKDVSRIFIIMALSIGAFGGLAGLLLGVLLSAGIDQVPFRTTSLPTISTYPVSYAPFIYIIGGVFSLLFTWLAGWLPSRKAGTIDPVIIIRGK
ncbi:ABC transporter permease [Chitinophaga sedimenti]|uniref:ABC transporter permease n=1 Tax=Chitinophaga sedimenti TaxID=2033606 RepID=UPI002004B4C5|nr:FtsX-like permease family protein [Chitinophaga sedimenti]MCK7557131.1 ABC transporter permease [Chitinophaga sedimenti]